MNKVGRNDRCSCGSGRKFKKCCMDIPTENFTLKEAIEKVKARQLQVEKQQGLGRPIVSLEHNGYRIIAVGAEVFYSKKWRTFHDFLSDYIKNIFGKKWGENELLKPEKERHQLFHWMDLTHKHMKKYESDAGGIFSAPMIGATYAFLSLSYNLYLLAHNSELQSRLIKRLGNKSYFEAALYETYVAAMFISAGYEVLPENEGDVRTDHAEFIATAPISGKKYSVEAKWRATGKDNSSIGNQLYAALKKSLPHERVIFIDVNIPSLMDKVGGIVQELKNKEQITIDGEPAPAAYVFITNHSFAYDLSGGSYERTGFAHGFKIDDFQINSQFKDLREALNSRKRHQDMDSLVLSIKEHKSIPATFDGEIPLFAFNERARSVRLLIGNNYFVPGKDGAEVIGKLETATVQAHEKKVYGVYLLADGGRVICVNPISDEELEAYGEHPETFFGVPLNINKKITDAIELYDFFYSAHKQTPKDRILKLMIGAADFEYLQTLSQESLACAYCERLVYRAMNFPSPH